MDQQEIPEEVRHLYPNHQISPRANNDNDDDIYPRDEDNAQQRHHHAGNDDEYARHYGEDDDDDDEEEEDGEYALLVGDGEERDEEDDIDRIPDDDPLLQDEQLYNEVLEYLMKGNKADYASNSPPVHHMPSAMQRVLGSRHVTVESEPRDIIPGPVQLIDLPLGLALLFDVATDETFVERWASRRLEPLKAPEGAAESSGGADSGENKERRLLPAGAGEEGGGAAPAASASTPEKKEGEDEGKKEEGGDGAKEEEDKKDAGDNEDAGGADGDDDGGEKKKKKKRIVEKPGWGGPPKQKPPPSKKFSTLVKAAPRPKVEFHTVSDINAGLKLQGPPQWVPYLAYLCALPPPRPDRCVSLYDSGKAQIEHHSQRERDIKRQKEEEEVKQCTFHPEVTAAVKRMPGWKGDMVKFYEDKRTWVTHVNRKLEKKILKQQREEEELYEKWKMPDKSKKILEKRDRRLRAQQQSAEGEGSGADGSPRAADRRGVEVVAIAADSPGGMDRSVSGYSGGVAAQAAESNTGFTPVTNSHRFRHMTQVKAGAGDVSRSVSAANYGENDGGDGGDLTYNYTAILDEFAPPEQLVSGELTQKQFLSRMRADLKGREERKKQRAIQFARQQKEKLFDPVTGQPLFEPNSAPTIVRQDGQRISFGELSAKEKKDLIRKLKQRGRLDFVPGTARRSHNDQHTVGDEEVQEMYKRMLEKVRQGTVRIDRIRRREDRELEKLFRPTIDKGTAKLIRQQGQYRKPVYKLPLPTKPPPPPPKPEPKSSAAKMANVVDRNTIFQSTKVEAVAKKREEKEAKDKLLTFQPSVSRNSNRIVAERRGQWQKEISVLEQRREEWRAARQGGEIHYASEVAADSSVGRNQQQQQGAAVVGQHHPPPPGCGEARQRSVGSNSGGRQRASPPGNFQAQQQHYDPVAEQYRQREESWHRPDARRVSNHYYFESDHPQRRPSPTLLGGRGHVAAAVAAQSSGEYRPSSQPVGTFVPPQQQQQQQQQQKQGAGYDDIDAIVGSMLGGGKQPQQQQQPSSGGNGAAQSLKFSSSPNSNERSLSEQQRLAALARARQQQKQQQPPSAAAATAAPSSASVETVPPAAVAASSESGSKDDGSSRRLRGILDSWDALERQTEAALGF